MNVVSDGDMNAPALFSTRGKLGKNKPKKRKKKKKGVNVEKDFTNTHRQYG